MTLTQPSLAPITAALIEALTAGTGRPIGDLAAPPAADAPYGFLTRLNPVWERSLRQGQETCRVTYQLQCVALDSAGVEWLEHRARVALAEPPTVEGWRLLRYRPPEGPAGIRLDRDSTPHLAYSTPQWRMWAQPIA